MIVLAHRANHQGIDKTRENTLEAIRYCLEKGWGIETDIRRASDGRYYISHDPTGITESNRADKFFDLFRRFPAATIALNIKELGYESDLVDYLERQKVVRQMFLFDMELLEDVAGRTAALFRGLSRDVRLAARVSDRGEPVDRALGIESAQVIWLDEFDRLWATEFDVRRMKAAGKTVYAISPEIHGFSLDEMRRRWRDFSRWGIDGICTDHSADLSREIPAGLQEAHR